VADRQIKWQVVRLPDGYAGRIIVPASGKHPATGRQVNQMVIKGPRVPAPPSPARQGYAKSTALRSAASLAASALDNPVVTALLPPGVGPALKGLRLLASSPRARALVREGGKAAFRFLASKLAS
jgi:hypothetical protein